MNAANVKPFRLVFSGGTALSRAHRLIRRMSEDIDLKIVSESPRSRAELRKLRATITKALLDAGFVFDPDNSAHRDSGNASRYTIYQLPYLPRVAGEGTLRPEIKVETAVWPLRLPSVDRVATSFWAEAFKQPEVSLTPAARATKPLCDTSTICTSFDRSMIERQSSPW